MEKIDKIMNSYSFNNQREKYIEELAEAIQATLKLKTIYPDINTIRKDSITTSLINFIDELADVIIMSEQMKRYINKAMGEGTVENAIQKKLDRQIDRINSRRCEYVDLDKF